MSLAEVLLITVPCVLISALIFFLVYRIIVLERVLRDLLLAIEAQGTCDDDMERLHVMVQVARKLVFG